jgi:ferredoxin
LSALSFVLSLASFAYFGERLSGWLSLQAGPNIAHLFSAFGVSSLAILVVIFLLTFVFGRFYCAVLCPLGILQSLIEFFVPARIRRTRRPGNYPRVRYLVAVFVFAMLVGGSAFAFSLLDPYSHFGRITTALFNPLFILLYNLAVGENLWQPITQMGWILVGALLPFLVLIGLVLWKGRVFCTAICPVGALLGLAAKKGWFVMQINQGRCIACGNCVRSCSAGCIDLVPGNPRAPKRVDNERCLRCMTCMGVCPRDAVFFGRAQAMGRSGAAMPSPALSRRDFLLGGAAGALTLGLGRFAYGLGATESKEALAASLICPPSAGSPQRFLSTCTNCDLCVTVCRGHVLDPATLRHPVVHLQFERGVCEYECKRCTDVCPTGALGRISLPEKQRLRIAMAELTLAMCVTVTDKTVCGACAEVCPTGALYMEEHPGDVSTPALDADACIGCGSCEYACPVRPVRAIVAKPVAIQVPADDPRPRDRTAGGGADSPSSGKEDWLF